MKCLKLFLLVVLTVQNAYPQYLEVKSEFDSWITQSLKPCKMQLSMNIEKIRNEYFENFMRMIRYMRTLPLLPTTNQTLNEITTEMGKLKIICSKTYHKEYLSKWFNEIRKIILREHMHRVTNKSDEMMSFMNKKRAPDCWMNFRDGLRHLVLYRLFSHVFYKCGQLLKSTLEKSRNESLEIYNRALTEIRPGFSANYFISTTNQTIWNSLTRWASQHKEITANQENFTNQTIVEAFDEVVPTFEAACDEIIDCIGRENAAKKNKRNRNGETTTSPDVVHGEVLVEDEEYFF